MLSCKFDEAKKVLVITIDTQTPKPSASGKTLVVASSHGNQPVNVEIPGQPGKTLRVGVNAYFDK